MHPYRLQCGVWEEHASELLLVPWDPEYLNGHRDQRLHALVAGCLSGQCLVCGLHLLYQRHRVHGKGLFTWQKNKWSPVSKSALDIMFACFRLYMWQPHSLTWCWLFSSSVPPHCLELLMDWCTSSLLKWVWSLASTSGDLHHVSQAQWPDVLFFFLLSL